MTIAKLSWMSIDLMCEVSLDVVFVDLERNYTSKGNYITGLKVKVPVYWLSYV